MSDIKKEEMFGNLKGFLKSKGIEIQDGSYANGIRKGCDILTDTVNMSQRAFDRAKVAVDKVRQTVHEKTAPRSKAASGANQTRTKSSAGKTSSAKTKTASSTRGKKRTKL